MGIDRIGKGGGVPPSSGATGPSGPTRAHEASRPFPLRTEKAAEAAAVAPVGSSPLERLRAGQLDVNGYVDAKVDEATRHLAGLSPVELDGIRKMLREQVASDPALVDLVKQATGGTPSVPEE